MLIHLCVWALTQNPYEIPNHLTWFLGLSLKPIWHPTYFGPLETHEKLQSKTETTKCPPWRYSSFLLLQLQTTVGWVLVTSFFSKFHGHGTARLHQCISLQFIQLTLEIFGSCMINSCNFSSSCALGQYRWIQLRPNYTVECKNPCHLRSYSKIHTRFEFHEMVHTQIFVLFQVCVITELCYIAIFLVWFGWNVG